MSGLGFVLGGALSGFGAGQAASIQMREEERRQIALENLRSSNQRAETSTQYDLMDRNNSRQTGRETDKTLIVNRQQGDIQMQRDQKEQDFTLKRDQQQHKNEIEIIGVKGNQEQALMRIKSTLDQATDERSIRIRAEIENGQITQIVAGEDGYYAVRGNGKTEPLGIKPQKKASASEGGSMLDKARGAGATQQPAPAKTQAPARPQSKSYTQTEAAATAKKYGVSIDEVHSRMRAQGYKLSAG